MSEPMLLNAADLTAEAYGRKKPRYSAIPETVGLAVVLLVNRNTSHDRGIWLAHPEVSHALGLAAEAFAQTLTGKPSPAGWRGGALAGLRTLTPGAFHGVAEKWPWDSESGRDTPVCRFWLDDDEEWHWQPAMFRTGPPAIRVELTRRLVGQPRAAEAWEAMQEVMRDQGDRYRGRPHWRGVLAGWSSLHESPARDKDLYAQVIEGRDLAVERDAHWAEMMAEYNQRHPEAPVSEAPDLAASVFPRTRGEQK